MTSCEPSRSSAYSNDLRWRIVWQTLALRLHPKQVASNLGVDETTVNRIAKLFEETGSIEKKLYPAERAFRKLTEPAQFFILNLVVSKPGIYLREIKHELHVNLGVDVTESAICVFNEGWFHKATNQAVCTTTE